MLHRMPQFADCKSRSSGCLQNLLIPIGRGIPPRYSDVTSLSDHVANDFLLDEDLLQTNFLLSELSTAPSVCTTTREFSASCSFVQPSSSSTTTCSSTIKRKSQQTSPCLPKRLCSPISNYLQLGDVPHTAATPETPHSGDSIKLPHVETDISKWPLPQTVITAYLQAGLTNLFIWQAECLALGLDGRNLVYSAPTSAGKTLVAEILLLKKIVETGKKGLLILPFISVAREKMVSLQKMLKGSGIRVDGYMGAMHPKAGLALLDVAVCTIEKANSLVNRMVEEKSLDQIGIIVVDELHMVGDPHRGYLIELLLTKIRYLHKHGVNGNSEMGKSLQIVGMSATLPNLDAVARWIGADLYISDYRPVPLRETIKLGQKIYDKSWRSIRDVPSFRSIKPDTDHVIALCYETVRAGHSVLVFCPSRAWCESLASTIALEFSSLNFSTKSTFIQSQKLREVIEQLRQSPAGLDGALAKTVPYVTAFHHAGLTMDEREIIENAFKKCVVRVLIATTTLSCGVNLPARRVIIRSPIFNQSIMDMLTYHQMVGRAGRKGVDTEGESILICKEPERNKVAQLLKSSMRPVTSCLSPGRNDEVNPSVLRALLEIIANGAARSIEQVNNYMKCTLLSSAADSELTHASTMQVINALDSRDLISVSEEFNTLSPTQLGSAIVWSGLSLEEGFAVYQELEKARAQLNLENELHILYLITPLYLIQQVSDIDWFHYVSLWEKLPEAYLHVANLIGIKENMVMSAVRGNMGRSDPLVAKQTAYMRRFYCALMLNDLANESPLWEVAKKYQCNKGILQALQQGASTYAGMVTVFCEQLGGPTWSNLALLFDQFQNRLLFGVQRELVGLMRIELLTAKQARTLYKGGFQTLAKVAVAERSVIEELLRTAVSYQSKPQNENMLERKPSRNILLGGLPHSELEAADKIIMEARRILQSDVEAMGVQNFLPKSSV